MCMEDIRLMRETAAADFTVAVAGASVFVVKQERKRVALILQNIGANPCSVSLTPPVAIGQGMTLPVGANPVVLDLQKHGDYVTRGLYGIATAGLPTTIYVGESILQTE